MHKAIKYGFESLNIAVHSTFGVATVLRAQQQEVGVHGASTLRSLLGRVALEDAQNHSPCSPKTTLALVEPKGVGVCGRGVECYTGCGPVSGY